MPQFVETLIDLSPLIIAIASVIALCQLIIAKNDIRTRSEREAVCLAATKCEMVAIDTLPFYQKHLLDQTKVPIKAWELNDDKFTSQSLKDQGGGRKWAQSLRDNNLYTTGMDTLNRLEGIAMYFTNGAADENIAYPVIGSVFCIMVQQLSPLLIEMREGIVKTTTSGPYGNTVTLYHLWSSRQTHKKISDQMSELSARMPPQPEIKPIKPIGT